MALRVLLSLAVVLGLLWVVQRRLTRDARVGRTVNPVTIVGRQGIGQKASVVVVDIEGKRLILGVTEQSVNVLHTDDAPVEASGAAVFARSMTEAAVAEGELEPPLAFRPRRDRASSSRLGGSILSPATWQQTAAALRQRR